MANITPKPLLGWAIGGIDCFSRLAMNPMDIPAEHTFVFECEEERMDMEASLFMHKYHPDAFVQFPDFATDRADPLYGTPEDEFTLMDHHTCPGITPMSADTWPWIFGQPKPVFDIVVAPMIVPVDHNANTGVMKMVAVLSARYPMTHLALLWALHENTAHMRVTHDTSSHEASVRVNQDGQGEITIVDHVDVPDEKTVSVTIPWVIALPTYMDEWYEADIRAHADCNWDRYVVFDAPLS